ncbi:MAG: hypothetical protein DA408_01430 [Bacteroidetes bacterium]|nr:MAG: hypothetical protein DA408_01430 [Bacteroidota bacterium]
MDKENNELDRIIRAKLDRLEPRVKPGSWDRLAERLDAAEAAEAFDRTVGNRLDGLQVPYRQHSWAVLAARLELERRRMQAIVHYKAMEVSLLLLLFLTVWHQLPNEKITPAVTPSFPIADLAIPATTNPAAVVRARAETNNKAFSTADKMGAIPGSDLASLYKNGQQPDQKEVDGQNELKGMARRPAITELSPLPKVAVSGIPSAANAQQQLRELQARKADNLPHPSDAIHRNSTLAALASNAFTLLDYGNPNELLSYIRPAERQTFLRIGFVGSPDYNRIITPLQPIDDGTVVSLDRYSLGYSGGITLGIEHGRWEIETGAVYAARRYQAIPTIYVSGNIRDGFTGLGLRDFELNTANIPLNFRYNFLVHDKWRLYAQGGASLNLILGANYYTVDQGEDAGILRNPNMGRGTSSLEKPAPLQNKSLTPGWLEGGSLLENATLYGDFGVGLERYMTSSWSIFAQPTYHHSFQLFNDGLGPYRDQIHNFGVSMGVKVRL